MLLCCVVGTADAFGRLEARRTESLRQAATIVQRHFRGYRCRTKFQVMLKAIVTLQVGVSISRRACSPLHRCHTCINFTRV